MWKDQAFEEMIESYLAKEHSDIDLIVVASGLPEMKRRDELPPFRSSARIQDIWTPSRRTRCCAMTKLRRQRARLKQSLEDPNAVNYPQINSWACSSAKNQATMGILTDARAAIFRAATMSAGSEKPQQIQQNSSLVGRLDREI